MNHKEGGKTYYKIPCPPVFFGVFFFLVSCKRASKERSFAKEEAAAPRLLSPFLKSALHQSLLYFNPPPLPSSPSSQAGARLRCATLPWGMRQCRHLVLRCVCKWFPPEQCAPSALNGRLMFARLNCFVWGVSVFFQCPPLPRGLKERQSVEGGTSRSRCHKVWVLEIRMQPGLKRSIRTNMTRWMNIPGPTYSNRGVQTETRR